METDSAVGGGRNLAGVLARRWHLLLAVTVAFGAAGVLLSSLQSTLYTSTATMLLNDPGSTSVFSQNNRVIVDPSRYVRGQASYLTSTEVLTAATKILHNRLSVDELRTRVSATSSDQLEQVMVTATEPTAAGAAEVANAVCQAYRETVRSSAAQNAKSTTDELDQTISRLRDSISELDGQLASTKDGSADPALSAARQAAATQLLTVQSRADEIAVDTATYGDGVQMFEEAKQPSSPTQPRPSVGGVVGAFVGLLLAATVVWWRAEYRRKADEKQDPATVLGVPLLGDVPEFVPSAGGRALPAAYEPSSPAGEAYNFLVESIGFAMAATARAWPEGGAGGRVIAVTSPRQGDGKTVTTLNLAIAMARDDRRVAVVDGDERMRGLTRLAEVPDEPGLSDLGADVPVDQVLRSLDLDSTEGLDVIASGARLEDPASFFRTGRFRGAVGRLRGHADIIIVDSPPLLAVSDAAAIAAQADAVVLIVGRGTPLRVLAEVRHRLEFVGTPLLGYVFNKSTGSRRRYGHYGYGYGYGQQQARTGALPAGTAGRVPDQRLGSGGRHAEANR
ncbi:AAA family ATPase [Frankia sp. AgB1.9]|uniref:polysaccharide biosynthesis tyrosine autokinase n=1 Tax=unclassified Frankia TaxID=2632575 RepID=UPI0019316D7A|nr:MULTISPECIES: CpsD/CapB family tyrosine-protein kinase [unclassified Frankia]MBL7490758.1 AAA family ATPase [Frankia sp. AgW1.1]MBL7549879.1 AAA family ATPase [Frankia sp. AgB1.9]MBL7623005.1 AAA family ATPase [Frankia sp. AgB1.8]